MYGSQTSVSNYKVFCSKVRFKNNKERNRFQLMSDLKYLKIVRKIFFSFQPQAYFLFSLFNLISILVHRFIFVLFDKVTALQKEKAFFFSFSQRTVIIRKKARKSSAIEVSNKWKCFFSVDHTLPCFNLCCLCLLDV